jgi:hypothetical protein
MGCWQGDDHGDRRTAVSPLPGSGRAEGLAQAIAERVVNLVVEAIDIDALLAKVDMDALLARVDVGQIIERVDVDAIVSKVDVDGIVSKVDVDAIVDRVDVEKIIERVDVERIIERVDVEKIIDRVDVDKLIERVDVGQIIERVDIEKVVQRVDIDAIVEQTELGTIIARSTSGVASEALDIVRAQAVGLDDFVARWVNRVLHRDPSEWPRGPEALVGDPSGAPALTDELVQELDELAGTGRGPVDGPVARPTGAAPSGTAGAPTDGVQG